MIINKDMIVLLVKNMIKWPNVTPVQYLEKRKSFSPINRRLGIGHILLTGGDKCLLYNSRMTNPSTHFFVSLALLECKSNTK